MNQIIALSLVCLWVVVATYADMQFKATKDFLSLQFISGFICYAITSFIAVWTFRQQSWGWIFIVWSVMALGLGLIISVYIYNEPMTWRRILATILVIITIFLVE